MIQEDFKLREFKLRRTVEELKSRGYTGNDLHEDGTWYKEFCGDKKITIWCFANDRDIELMDYYNASFNVISAIIKYSNHPDYWIESSPNDTDSYFRFKYNKKTADVTPMMPSDIIPVKMVQQGWVARKWFVKHTDEIVAELKYLTKQKM